MQDNTAESKTARQTTEREAPERRHPSEGTGPILRAFIPGWVELNNHTIGMLKIQPPSKEVQNTPLDNKETKGLQTSKMYIASKGKWALKNEKKNEMSNDKKRMNEKKKGKS